MFQSWRVKLREAELAYRDGQLEEASRLLCEPTLREFLPAKRLLHKVAGQLAKRGEARAAGGQTLAGWRDLDSALRLGADQRQVQKLREKMLAQMLAEVERYVTAGDYRAALARLDELDRRQANTQETRRLRQVAEKMAAAQRLARRGRFSEAEQELAVALPLSGDLKLVQQWQDDFRVKAGQLRELSQRLHQAVAAEDWQQTLERADAILELAPDDRAARDARHRAWEAVGMRVSETIDSRPKPFRLVHPPMSDSSRDSGRPSDANRGERFIAWVDEVGAFLICLGGEVTIGQPGPANRVDIPLLADLSRVHAKIRRNGEGYLLEPLRPVGVNGVVAAELVPLTDGALVEPGASVRLRFRKPHPLSATARLEFASRHRTQPSVDGVILMAESCVLGPAIASHVVCPQWSREVVLFRQGSDLICRTRGPLVVDGRTEQDQAVISTRSTVSGPDFSFTLEAL